MYDVKDHRAGIGVVERSEPVAVSAPVIRWLCRVSSQFEAHPVLVEVGTVQKDLFTDRAFLNKTFAFIEVNRALIICPDTQIDLLHNFRCPRPPDEGVEHQ